LAGRNPHEALDAFIGPLQRAVSCVTRAQVYVRPPRPDEVQALTISEDPVTLGTTGDPGARLRLSIQQQYQLVEVDDPERGPWKVSTRAYRYEVAEAQGLELLACHWHPAGKSRWKLPHPHVSGGRLHGMHLPSSRVSLEALLRVLLAELEVRPLRADWVAVLDAAEQAFADYRTWAYQDLDEAERGAQPPQGGLLVGVDLGHPTGQLPPRRLVPPSAQVQIDPAALPLELVVILSPAPSRLFHQRRCVKDHVHDGA
jgi:hypothetical protein